MALQPDAAAASGLRRGHLALVGAGVLLVVIVLVVVFAVHGHGGSGTRAAPTTSPSASPRTTPSVSDIYQRVGPAVVVVRTAKGALGTGVIAADDGTILTADHVIADGSAISVTFADGTKSRATAASADPKTDTATLTPLTLPQPVVPATLGGDAEVGGEVVAIGNPLGLTYSVSAGVVYGLDRDTNSVSGLIQFDAAVNPGSSGGPLIDGDTGAVVGIVQSIADPGGDGAFAGIGFAIPIAQALGGGGKPVPL